MEWLKVITEWLDDKSQVIAALFVIAILVILFNSNITDQVSSILSNIISGLLGVAIGRALPKTNGNGNTQ